jgi:ADP-heptose:LPS heptosyltransferase
MQKCKILVRLEGGLGDCLLSNRFIPAIKEKHSNCTITAGYDNSRGEKYQLDILKEFYPSSYDSFEIFQNLKKENFDFFYDLHIDKMEWTKYDFDWLSRFYYFPKPEKNINKKDFICVHLTHDKWEPKNLRKEYIEKLITELYDQEKNIIAICTEGEAKKYENLLDKVTLKTGSAVEACVTVAESKAFITIDSGFKYIAYAYGVPTIETADYYTSLGSTHPMIKARWLPFSERGIPLYSDPKLFSLCLKNITENRISSIFPFHNSNHETFQIK